MRVLIGCGRVAEEGLSKMARNHIHLAQGVAVDGVISGKPRLRVHTSRSKV